MPAEAIFGCCCKIWSKYKMQIVFIESELFPGVKPNVGIICYALIVPTTIAVCNVSYMTHITMRHVKCNVLFVQ